MSKRSDDPAKALVGKPGYEVGYGKPPVASRFKPGQSGNPRGRPRGAKNKRPGMHEERMKDIILEEAYRGITIRDGDRNVTIPLAQAVMRSMGVKAVQGHARAQRLFAELLATVESSQKILHDQWLDTAIGYKVEWERELERRDRLGITDLPEPIPHPDHIDVDLDRGTVHIAGPRTKEEKAELDDIIDNKHLLIEDLRDLNLALEETTDPKERRRLERLMDEKFKILEIINKFEPRTGD